MVGCTRSEISALRESTPVPQEPFALGISIRWVSLPCLPMVLPAFVNSRIICSLREMISLSVSQILPFTPTSSIGIRTPKFPFRTSIKIRNNSLSSRRDSSGGNSHLTREELFFPPVPFFPAEWLLPVRPAPEEELFFPAATVGGDPFPLPFLISLLAAIDNFFLAN